ncbi:tetratricopeptide repeat protein [Algicella marina]|uniref:Tetratricopeptide repeat protein n=1 Tax=Algicella marina TaxID=2683284 RepID=A0A6P1T649_9RHOB|nr:hypothetical protein [Algicella marina]QHQ37225.1 hypothetical protein GO499_19565 [Algicella marina]
MTLRGTHLTAVAILATLGLAGCDNAAKDREAIESLDGLNVIDESGLNDIMLNFADPNAAANYFRNALNNEPTRIDFKRGYARSLMRAHRSAEAVLAYEQMNAAGEMNNDDRLSYSEALLQNGDWAKAEAQLNAIPPTVETYDRYRLEAMMADYHKDWKKADSFYETARGLTTRPAAILNNWGISKMSRKDFKGAEGKFVQAISFNPKLFSAKNNLVISRANRKIYDLPVVPMTGIEKAQLLHNMALQAIRNGDVQTGRGLLEEAVDTHPQHFPEAVRKLAALERNVAR